MKISYLCTALLHIQASSAALAFTGIVDRTSFLRQSCSSVLLSTVDEMQSQPTGKDEVGVVEDDASKQIISYRSMNVYMDEFDVNVPVAVWYPAVGVNVSSDEASSAMNVRYDHQISVSRIGQLLAGWNFLPGFLKRSYMLEPSTSSIILGGRGDDIPEKSPAILLAHGYLGSRYDLSHIAESLAQDGFVCISPEYPESLAASYERLDGLDRSKITKAVIDKLVNEELNVQSKRRGIIGHSLGCGTVANTGDSSWVRVCIAGFAADIEGSPTMLISSTNDGAVPYERIKDRIPKDFQMLGYDSPLVSNLSLVGNDESFPQKVAVILDGDDAPNHISFLCDGVNKAMINLLSPLLPIAQALGIPVLDFDKYKISQDSESVAKTVKPIVKKFLKDNLR